MPSLMRPDHRAPVRPRTAPDAMRLLIARLTDRDRRIMALVHRHRTLTTTQLADLEFTSYAGAKKRLHTLYRLRALERFRPWTPVGSAPWHYLLDAPGAEILAAEHGQTAREWGYRRDRVLTLAYRSSLDHTLGVNDLFIALETAARTRPTTELVWRTAGECQASIGDIVRPDAAGTWTARGRTLAFYLEYDTGTEPLRRLDDKLERYHELARLTDHRGTVLLSLPSAKRQENLHRRLAGGALVPVATAVHGAHPAGAVWTPLGEDRPRTLADLAPRTAAVQPVLPGWDDTPAPQERDA